MIRGGPTEFTTTRWSVVLRACDADSAQALEALEQLCQSYWYPLYAFARRKGHSPEDASDVTQEFFARLLRTDFVPGLVPGRGRFRSYLLTALNHFLIDEWKRGQAQKRGAGLRTLSLDAAIGEEGELSYQMESPNAGPEELFDRAWAETILKRVLQRLSEECRERGDHRFKVLRPFLAADDDPPALGEAASELGLTLAAFKSLLHRFRQRYRELLLAEIGQTVSSEAELASEVRELMTALRGE